MLKSYSFNSLKNPLLKKNRCRKLSAYHLINFYKTNTLLATPKVNSDLAMMIDPDSLHPEHHWSRLCGCPRPALLQSLVALKSKPGLPSSSGSSLFLVHVFEAGYLVRWRPCSWQQTLTASHPSAVTGFDGFEQSSSMHHCYSKWRQLNPHND